MSVVNDLDLNKLHQRDIITNTGQIGDEDSRQLIRNEKLIGGQRWREGGWGTTKKIMYLMVDKREIEVTQCRDLQGRQQ